MHKVWSGLDGYRPARSILAAFIAAAGLAIGPALAADPVKIGHVAALSGGSAQSGEAITRGLTIAIDEINAKGGVLGGRKLELVQRDDEFNSSQRPDRGARACLQGEGCRSFSAGSTAPSRSRWCRSSTRRRSRTWRSGPPAPASRAMAQIPTTSSASPRSTCWST